MKNTKILGYANGHAKMSLQWPLKSFNDVALLILTTCRPTKSVGACNSLGHTKKQYLQL